jgi:hypothetical protein
LVVEDCGDGLCEEITGLCLPLTLP